MCSSWNTGLNEKQGNVLSTSEVHISDCYIKASKAGSVSELSQGAVNFVSNEVLELFQFA